MSNPAPPSAAAASYTLGLDEVASTPAAAARRRASASAGADRSSPVTRAPSRPSETVSVPMWHCRWTSVEAGDVAEPRTVELDDVAEEVRILDEAVDGVVGRRGVSGRALVPEGAVEFDGSVHELSGQAGFDPNAIAAGHHPTVG